MFYGYFTKNYYNVTRGVYSRATIVKLCETVYLRSHHDIILLPSTKNLVSLPSVVFDNLTPLKLY